MKNEYLKIGYISGTHGLKGNCKVVPTTDFVEDRFLVGAKLFVQNGFTKETDALTITHVTSYKNVLTITFKEIASIEKAEMYIGQSVLIPRSEGTLPPDHFYLHDLVGLNVVLVDGSVVGKVSEILEFASYYTLRVKRDGSQDVLIPFIDEFIVETNLKKKQIVFKPIEGML